MFPKVIFWMAVFLMTCSGTAFADQAAWISKTSATRAENLISPGTKVRRYCAPCGDTRWIEVEVDRIETRKVSDSNYQLFLNGDGVDLAYVYLPRGQKWRNLGLILNLPVTNVPEFLPETGAPPSTGMLDDIDQRVAECMVKDDTAAGMANCLFEGYEMWDEELNRVYRELRGRLGPEGQAALKATQLAWLGHRDLEFALIDDVYSGFDGAMYIPMRVEDRMNIVKNRVMELKSYIDLMENH